LSDEAQKENNKQTSDRHILYPKKMPSTKASEISGPVSLIIWSTLLAALTLMIVLLVVVQDEAKGDCQVRGGSMNLIGPLVASIGIIMAVGLLVLSSIFARNANSPIFGVSILSTMLTAGSCVLMGFAAQSLDENWICSSSNRGKAIDVHTFTIIFAVGMGLLLVVGVGGYYYKPKKKAAPDTPFQASEQAKSSSPTINIFSGSP
jgi:hypothetical protein